MSTLLIGAAAVLRTLAVVGVGGFTGTVMQCVETSNTWFSVLNVYVFLPCLLFGHFSTTFSLAVLHEGLPLVVLGVCRIVVGAVTTKAAVLLGMLDDGTAPLSMLATSSSNAIAIPLAILAELTRRVDFLSSDPAFAVRDAGSGRMVPAAAFVTTLMFVYAIPINFAIWSFGQFFIRSAAERRQKEHDAERAERQLERVRADASLAAEAPSDPPVVSPTLAGFAGSPQLASQIAPFANSGVGVVAARSAPPSAASADSAAGGDSLLCHVFRVYILRSMSVPLVASFSGIAVALLPSVQDGITGGWPMATAALNAVQVLGQAAVPSALCTVGVTIYRTLTKTPALPPPAVSAVVAAARGVDDFAERQESTTLETMRSARAAAAIANGAGAVVYGSGSGNTGDRGESLVSRLHVRLSEALGIQASLVLTTSAVQLIATPLVVFLVVTQFLYTADIANFSGANGTASTDNSVIINSDAVVDAAEPLRRKRLMIFTLLMESMCPSAMNTAIICTLYRYRSEDFARMIVIQYVASVVTMSLWLSLYLATV